ncbi:hypothetical protein [Pyrobaculum ferrireducens]|nr:hypothetical protein [Pyrobaculum ferrireducens]
MRSVASAVFMAFWTFADIVLRMDELRHALERLILEEAQRLGQPVLVRESVDATWSFFVPTAVFASFFIQLAVYAAWSLAFKIGGCRRGFATALVVVAVLTAALWLLVLPAVFFMGLPIEQPLMYLALNAGLAFIKYSECPKTRLG